MSNKDNQIIRKRKRIKLECFNCGSSFNQDYRRKHEKNMHGCAPIKVKDISFGKANNSFDAARIHFERKIKVPTDYHTIFNKIFNQN